jgi:hypothetical protein
MSVEISSPSCEQNVYCCCSQQLKNDMGWDKISKKKWGMSFIA